MAVILCYILFKNGDYPYITQQLMQKMNTTRRKFPCPLLPAVKFFQIHACKCKRHLHSNFCQNTHRSISHTMFFLHLQRLSRWSPSFVGKSPGTWGHNSILRPVQDILPIRDELQSLLGSDLPYTGINMGIWHSHCFCSYILCNRPC